MDKKHLPYNVLLVIAVAAIGLMAVCSFGLRQSSFAVTVGYRLPQPQTVPASSASEPRTSRPVSQEASAVVPQEEPPPREETEDGEPGGAAVTSVQFPLELNEASYEQLLFIPGVGDVMAQRITQYRDHLGGAYERLDQLMEIKGIGAQTYQKITAYLYLGEAWPADGGGEPDAEEYGGGEYDDKTDLEGQI